MFRGARIFVLTSSHGTAGFFVARLLMIGSLCRHENVRTAQNFYERVNIRTERVVQMTPHVEVRGYRCLPHVTYNRKNYDVLESAEQETEIATNNGGATN